MAVFTISQRGQFKLRHNGFEYHKQREGRDDVIWICEKRQLKCRGKAKTYRVGSVEIVKAIVAHNHPSNQHDEKIPWEEI